MKNKIIGLGLATVSSVAAYAMFVSHRQPIFELYIFPLQGSQSYLIRTPQDERILIDGGLSSAVIRSITSVLPFYSRRIDAVIVTNGNSKDHLGLAYVLERYEVGRLYIPKHLEASSSVSILRNIAKDQKVEVVEVSEGNTYKYGDVVFDVIFPADDKAFTYSKASPPTLVLRISNDNHSILLLGAVSKKIQKYIAKEKIIHLKSDAPIKSDVLISSVTDAPDKYDTNFIKSVAPMYLVYDRGGSSQTSNSRGESSGKNGKGKKEDPFMTILMENRFNIRKSKQIKITSAGGDLEIRAE